MSPQPERDLLEEQLLDALSGIKWPEPETEPRPPLDRTEINSSVDVVSVAAGYADAETLTRVASSTESRQKLRRLWQTEPPEPTVLARAWSEQGVLLGLLTELHLDSDTSASRQSRGYLAGLGAFDQPATSHRSISIPSHRRADYVVAAHDAQEPAVTDDFPGGRLVRQPFPDATVEVTLLISDAALGPAGRVFRLANPDHSFLALMILRPSDDPEFAYYSSLTTPGPEALDEMDVAGPLLIEDLTSEDIEAVATVIQWSDPVTTAAWDAAAAGNEPLTRAIDRGIAMS